MQVITKSPASEGPGAGRSDRILAGSRGSRRSSSARSGSLSSSRSFSERTRSSPSPAFRRRSRPPEPLAITSWTRCRCDGRHFVRGCEVDCAEHRPGAGRKGPEGLSRLDETRALGGRKGPDDPERDVQCGAGLVAGIFCALPASNFTQGVHARSRSFLRNACYGAVALADPASRRSLVRSGTLSARRERNVRKRR